MSHVKRAGHLVCRVPHPYLLSVSLLTGPLLQAVATKCCVDLCACRLAFLCLLSEVLFSSTLLFRLPFPFAMVPLVCYSFCAAPVCRPAGWKQTVAEKVTVRGGGCVVRLAGLYSLQRGPHSVWLDEKSVSVVSWRVVSCHPPVHFQLYFDCVVELACVPECSVVVFSMGTVQPCGGNVPSGIHTDARTGVVARVREEHPQGRRDEPPLPIEDAAFRRVA